MKKEQAGAAWPRPFSGVLGRLGSALLSTFLLIGGAALPGLAQSAERAAKKAVEADRPTSAAKQRSGSAAASPAVARKSAARTSSARSTSSRRTRAASKTTVASRKSAGASRKARRDADAKRPSSGRVVSVAHVPSARPTIGQAFGLHEVYDPLSLHSSVALMLDARTGQVLFEKNSDAVLPIASITKLMTAMVVLDAGLPLDEALTISEADIDTERFSRSRLRVGTVLTRDEMLNLALMSSENRAANALGRHYPGGLDAFVAKMNAKAREIGMTSSRFVEPTGLSSSNVSNARDLARLVEAAARYPLIRSHSTADSLTVAAGRRSISFRNTNRLVRNPDWEIGLQKTGYISEAGNCLVMQASIEGRPVVLVLLDAEGKLSRYGDAKRLRDWLESVPRFDSAPRALAQPSSGS